LAAEELSVNKLKAHEFSARSLVVDDAPGCHILGFVTSPETSIDNRK
jgi:hypothetical protein